MDDRRLPFMEHLRELRDKVRNSVIALMLCTIIAFIWSQELFVILARPMIVAWHNAGLGDAEINFGSLTEPFWVYFKVSMYVGVFIASPIIFYQLWQFIAPGLYKKERRVALPFAICSGLCFIGGALFCYFLVFPAAYGFFLHYTSDNLSHIRSSLGFATDLADPLHVRPTLFMDQYLDLTIKMLLGFGLVFEMPMLIFFLSYVGLVTHRSLWKFNKYAIVLSFIIGAILTPGPDVVSQFLMATPMVVLYNMSILVAYFVTRSKEKARAAAGDAPPPDDDDDDDEPPPEDDGDD
jgi:sec-independent protein translocase protein TatC